jgi:hypothetical protein
MKGDRRLGVLGVVLAVAILVVGTVVAVIGGRAGDGPPGVPIALITFISLANFLAFGLLVAVAIAFRATGAIVACIPHSRGHCCSPRFGPLPRCGSGVRRSGADAVRGCSVSRNTDANPGSPPTTAL